MAATSPDQPNERLRVRLGVVQPVDHDVLVAHPAAGGGRVAGRRRDDRPDRPAPIERDQQIAQGVARRMQAHRERPLGAERGQALDPRHDARRRDREVAGAEPEAFSVGDRLGRGDHRVEVEQGLAHAHEDEVREVAAAGRQPATGVADLVDDLRHLEVPLEAQLTGGAERAADRTARLAADAQGVALATLPARRVVHQDALHEPAVGEAMERLLRGVVVGETKVGLGDRVEAKALGEAGPERPAQGRDRVPGGRIRAPDGVGDLLGAERGLAHVGQERGEGGRLQAGDAGPWIARRRSGTRRRRRAGLVGHRVRIIPPGPRAAPAVRGAAPPLPSAVGRRAGPRAGGVVHRSSPGPGRDRPPPGGRGRRRPSSGRPRP